MNNLFIVTVLLFLSCNDKNTPIKTSDLIAKMEISSFDLNVVEIINENSDSVRRAFYKGTLNGTIKIWLYLNEQEHPCGGNLTILNAMYKYDNQDKWILLDATSDTQKKKYCMVEDGFSGVLFLEEDNNTLNGNWISPDTKKQFKVILEKLSVEKTPFYELDEILFDDLLYNKNDC